MRIIITPAFPETWWFGAFCILLIGVFIFGVYHYHLQKKLRELFIRNEIVTELHDHIRIILNTIATTSEAAEREDKNKFPNASVLLQEIKQNTIDAIDLMKDIAWVIDPKNDKFEKILFRMRTFASGLLESKNIDLTFIAAPSLSVKILSMPQRKNLYLIFKEAVTNVAKYSKAKYCSVTLKNEGNNLVMEIFDNGVGFDINRSLLGNGLTGMKKSGEELNAELIISSKIDHGTLVHLFLAPL